MSSVSILSRGQFERVWAPDYGHVFLPRDLQDNPFASPGWRIVCICGPRGYVMDQHPNLCDVSDPHGRINAALFNTIRATGDDGRIGGCLVRAPHLNASYFEASRVNPAALLEMRRLAIDGFDLHVFGHSRRWGVVASWLEEFALVGGDDPFMDEFIAAAGGDEAVLRAFMNCAEYLLEFSAETREFVRQAMSLAHWLPPASTEH
jgi:hypothetical protein